MGTTKQKLVKYTPDQFGRKLLRKYLLAICPALSPHAVAGAITAAGPKISGVIAYLQKKYGLEFSIRPGSKELTSMYRKGAGPRFKPYARVDQGEPVLLILDDFIGYDEDMLYEFFMLQETKVFEIIIPRNWENNDELNETIFFFAAYAGQLLHGQSELFSYFTPSAKTCEAIRFIVTIRDIFGFTKLFRQIVSAYFQLGSRESTLAFMQQASDFVQDAYGNVDRCYTWGLVETAMMISRGLWRDLSD